MKINVAIMQWVIVKTTLLEPVKPQLILVVSKGDNFSGWETNQSKIL